MTIRSEHRIVALIACVLVPLATCVFDRGAVGYTMYAGVTTYRLRVTASRNGAEMRVSCNDIARQIGGSAPLALVGADSWRPGRSTRALESHLDAVARGACVVTSAESVIVVLETPSSESARIHERCP